jgi:hypothetical protein
MGGRRTGARAPEHEERKAQHAGLVLLNLQRQLSNDAYSLKEVTMYAAPTMTTSEARETINRLSEQTESLRRYDVVTDSWIAEYNDSLVAFVPRDKMALFHIGKGRYTGDTALPGAFVQGGLFRQLVESARTGFDTLLMETQQQAPAR